MGDEKVENVELATARKPHKKGNAGDSETIGSSPTALVSDKQNSGYNGSWQPVTQRVYRCKKAVISAPPSQAFGSRTPQQRSEDPWRRPLGFTWQNLSEWPWIQMDPRLHGQIILDDSRFQLFPTFHSQILLISFGPCQPLKIPPPSSCGFLRARRAWPHRSRAGNSASRGDVIWGSTVVILLDGSISKTTPLVSWFDLVIQKTEDHRTSYNYPTVQRDTAAPDLFPSTPPWPCSSPDRQRLRRSKHRPPETTEVHQKWAL